MLTLIKKIFDTKKRAQESTEIRGKKRRHCKSNKRVGKFFLKHLKIKVRGKIWNARVTILACQTKKQYTPQQASSLVLRTPYKLAYQEEIYIC